MFRSIVLAISMVWSGAALAAPTHAQDVELHGDVAIVREVERDGALREERAEPTRVLPGDQLVFVTHYRNAGTDTAEDFIVTNPLPPAVMLAREGNFDVSVDGGATFGPLSELTVGDGGADPRAAGLADVTHVRWTVARIAPGGEGQMEFFATVR